VEAIVEQFKNRVDAILDAGPLVSDPSTILDLTGEHPVVIRQGAGDVSFLL
jgi:tRNA A37 threonylcarbamoyladenosine synthetase subunit TsaC/SUA5/YrdC